MLFLLLKFKLILEDDFAVKFNETCTEDLVDRSSCFHVHLKSVYLLSVFSSFCVALAVALLSLNKMF